MSSIDMLLTCTKAKANKAKAKKAKAKASVLMMKTIAHRHLKPSLLIMKTIAHRHLQLHHLLLIRYLTLRQYLWRHHVHMSIVVPAW